MGLVLAFTAIAVVNTLAMSVSERVREFASAAAFPWPS